MGCSEPRPAAWILLARAGWYPDHIFRVSLHQTHFPDTVRRLFKKKNPFRGSGDRPRYQPVPKGCHLSNAPPPDSPLFYYGGTALYNVPYKQPGSVGLGLLQTVCFTPYVHFAVSLQDVAGSTSQGDNRLLQSSSSSGFQTTRKKGNPSQLPRGPGALHPIRLHLASKAQRTQRKREGGVVGCFPLSPRICLRL